MPYNAFPKFSAAFNLTNINAQQFLALAFRAAKNLHWNVTALNANKFTAVNPAYPGFEVVVYASISRGSITSFALQADTKTAVRNNQYIATSISDEIQAISGNIHSAEESSDLHYAFQHAVEQYKKEGKDNPKQSYNLFKNLVGIVIPGENYTITPIIIGLNILVFLVMCMSGVSFISPTVEELVKWGGVNRFLVLEDGEWWRLLTAAFLHGGILHIGFNMYAFFFVGVLLEPVLGKLRFSAAYLLCALTSSFASIWWQSNSVSVGASGAIFGIYGVLLALLVMNHHIADYNRNSLLKSILFFIVINIFIIGNAAGIDNAGHIGGLVGGVVIGFLYTLSLKKPENRGLYYGTIVSAVILFASAGYYLLERLH
ncbi:rhomboid protease GluP [Chitinophaga skermanii]|uniref:Rhomboid protease GluP n=1 Tax=Chitinophaga skermanii TaxID=331697 RepID=A0A327QAR2_9BACT|nr:rhomboid family intramembrane serine protease [Chitinophaga skermanii]RAJ01520.1 rhomboid protease GluP [Chitinophaga skermanii]